MDIIRRLISVVAALGLAISLIGTGFLMCIAPFTTAGLANAYANDTVSPFTRSQLVQVADTTRDYSFGSHNKLALYKAIAKVDLEYQQSIEEMGGKVASNFPDLHNITQDSSEAQYGSAFRNASEVYCYSESVIAHLDDCYQVFITVIPFLVISALSGISCLIAVGVLGKKRHLGGVFMAAGIAVIALLVLLGAWAIFDFNGFFDSFHTLFFTQDTWSFPADSLLICALPLNFWMGMGVVWIATTITAAVLCILIGRILRSGRKLIKHKA